MKFVDLTLRGGVKLTTLSRTIQSRYDKGYSTHSAEVSGVAIFFDEDGNVIDVPVDITELHEWET